MRPVRPTVSLVPTISMRDAVHRDRRARRSLGQRHLVLLHVVVRLGVRGMHQRCTRVLHVFGRMDRGGAELRTLELMRYLGSDKVRQEFCVLSGQPGSLDNDIRQLGGEVHYCPLDFRFVQNFSRLLQAGQFDVVHSHVHLVSGFIVRLAAANGIPKRVVHFRTTGDVTQSKGLRHARDLVLRRWIDRYATDILAVSEGTMRAVWRKDWTKDKRCRIVYNGFDVRRFEQDVDAPALRKSLGIPSGAVVVIHVGRMDRAKNHQRLVRIFASLHSKVPNSYLVMLGRPEPRILRDVEETVSALGIDDHVKILGERSDVPQLLRAADLMIFPSLFEGLPGAVVEAVASGLPVLASDIPGCMELAAYFPHMVHCISLDLSDDLWSTSALRILASCRAPHSNFAFDESPFSIVQCAQSFMEVWGIALDRNQFAPITQ